MSTTELKGTVILATDTSAKVGIGTSAPAYTLDVSGTMNVTGAIGNTNSNIVMNASNIKKNIKTQDGTIIQDIIGNSDQTLSMSRCYNHKVEGGSATLNIFLIENQNNHNYMSAYGELVISGANGNVGAYTGKWSFIIGQPSGLAQLKLEVITLDKSYNGVALADLVSVNGTTLKKCYIAYKPLQTSSIQNYCATLTVYPTESYDGGLNDFSITAV
jgi:hypothetical protein